MRHDANARLELSRVQGDHGVGGRQRSRARLSCRGLEVYDRVPEILSRLAGALDNRDLAADQRGSLLCADKHGDRRAETP